MRVPSIRTVTDDTAADALTDRFPPIADYGFLSDCENSCLVAPNGAVEWLCLPRPDSPSLFGALLDRTAGNFRVGPTSTQVPHHRRYIPGPWCSRRRGTPRPAGCWSRT